MPPYHQLLKLYSASHAALQYIAYGLTKFTTDVHWVSYVYTL